ncbi:MAG: SDR family NAD(P)-dependent oxidoreductase, partial [Pseudomonadota bacterium]
MYSLNAKVALVTGGASGIGRASCEALAAAGATVVVADIDEPGARATATSIGESSVFQHLDVSRENDWERAMQNTIDRFDRLDIVVNCAGIGFTGHAEDIEMEAWNAIVAVNLTGTMLACKHAIRTIKPFGRGGSIINISSIAGQLGAADKAAYCATKGGVTLLSKSVALDCAALGYGIRCNAIHPTYVDT